MVRSVVRGLVLLALASSVACQPVPPRAGSDTEAAAPAQLALTESSADPSRGPALAPVTVIVFGDYGCQHCRRANAILSEMLSEPGAPPFRVVWKHFPADDEDAVSAAVLSHGLFDLGGNNAFWAFHDMVFREEFAGLEMRSRVARGLAYARDGLEADTQAIAKAAQLEGVDQVRSSVEMGTALGIRALPTLFVNGRRMVGVKDAASIRQLIEDESRAIAPLLAKGTPLAAAMDARLRHAAEEDPLLLVQPARDAVDAGPATEDVARALPTPSETVFRVPVGSSPTLGPADADVTIVAFTDFECGHCRSVQPTLHALLEEFPGKVRLVVKHNPLPFHPAGMRASLFAAHVLAEKGASAFFRVHDALYESELDDAAFRALAASVALDGDEAIRAVDEKRHLRAVEDDLLAADDVGARSTPTFFINGRALIGALPKEAFSRAIRAELESVAERKKSGIASEDLYAKIIEDGFTVPLPPRTAAPETSASTPARGPKKAPLVLHVFADLECHYCRVHAENVLRLESEFKGSLRVVFHAHPLRGERSRRAALAGMEAFRQKGNDGFFAFTDRIFALEGEIDDAVVEDTFTKSGLDPSKLAAAFANQKFEATLDAEIEAAKELGLSGTPMSILNDFRISGAVPYVRLRKLALVALEEAKAKSGGGGESEGSSGKRAATEGK